MSLVKFAFARSLDTISYKHEKKKLGAGPPWIMDDDNYSPAYLKCPDVRATVLSLSIPLLSNKRIFTCLKTSGRQMDYCPVPT